MHYHIVELLPWCTANYPICRVNLIPRELHNNTCFIFILYIPKIHVNIVLRKSISHCRYRIDVLYLLNKLMHFPSQTINVYQP